MYVLLWHISLTTWHKISLVVLLGRDYCILKSFLTYQNQLKRCWLSSKVTVKNIFPNTNLKALLSFLSSIFDFQLFTKINQLPLVMEGTSSFFLFPLSFPFPGSGAACIFYERKKGLMSEVCFSVRERFE
jgi:hypothetical protein